MITKKETETIHSKFFAVRELCSRVTDAVADELQRLYPTGKPVTEPQIESALLELIKHLRAVDTALALAEILPVGDDEYFLRLIADLEDHANIVMLLVDEDFFSGKTPVDAFLRDQHRWLLKVNKDALCVAETLAGMRVGDNETITLLEGCVNAYLVSMYRGRNVVCVTSELVEADKLERSSINTLIRSATLATVVYGISTAH